MLLDFIQFCWHDMLFVPPPVHLVKTSPRRVLKENNLINNIIKYYQLSQSKRFIMNAKWSLKDKKALITGATKRIGLAIAEEFLQHGADVFIPARNNAYFKSLKSKAK